MLSIFFIAILIIGIAGLAGLSLLHTQQSMATFDGSHQNKRQLDLLAMVVETNLRTAQLDGIAYAPMGEAAPEGWTTIPSWLAAQNKTPWGVSYVYCPYAPDVVISSGAASITQGDLTSYPVNTTTSTATGNRPYVTASAAPPLAGILAFIVSPLPNQTSPPACADVTLSAGRYTVPNGLVRVITRAQGHNQRMVAATHSVTLYVAPAAAGSADGSNASNAMTLDAALALWSATRPVNATLHLASGTYTVADNAVNRSADDPESHGHQNLTLQGAGRIATVLAPPAAENFLLAIPGLSLTVRDLTLGAGGALGLTHNTAQLRNLATPALVLKNSAVTLYGPVQLPADSGAGFALVSTNSDIALVGASLSITAAATNTGSAWLSGGSLDADNNSTLTLTIPAARPGLVAEGKAKVTLRGAALTGSVQGAGSPASLLSIGALADVQAESGSILTAAHYPSSALYVEGRLRLHGATLATPNGAARGVTVTGGGTLALSGGAQVGSATHRPDIAIYDGGGQGLYGASATAYALTSCWQGDLFYRSTDADMGSSAPTPTTPPDAIQVLNRSLWTCRR